MNNIPRKTKVLFVITKSNFGGAQKYVYELAAGLPKDQFDVVVALGGEGLLVDKLHEANIRTISIPSLMRDVNPLKDLATFSTLLKLFKKENPDIVHLNSAKVSGIGAVVARLAGVPKIIFTAHGWAFNEERPLLQRFVIKLFSWITVLLSHKTIAVSEAVKNDAKNWPFVNKKIKVIKNGIAVPEFYAKEIAREKLLTQTGATLPSNAFIVGTIAELHKSKGLQYSILAFEKLASTNPSLYYFILGGGEEKERLDALVKLHGLEERVFLLGFVKDAANFLRAFDVFVLPSITEGLALVLLEAGLAELPVVASRVGGIPEVIEDKKTGLLVPSRDPEALALAIKNLFDNPLLCTKLGTALHEKVLKDFSLGRVISETIALY